MTVKELRAVLVGLPDEITVHIRATGYPEVVNFSVVHSTDPRTTPKFVLEVRP